MYYISHCIPHSPPRPHTIAFGTYPYDSLSKLGLRSSRPLPTQVKGTWKNQTNNTNPWQNLQDSDTMPMGKGPQ